MKKHSFSAAMKSILALSVLSVLLTGCSKSSAPPPPPKDPANPGNATTDPRYLNRTQGSGGGMARSGGR